MIDSAAESVRESHVITIHETEAENNKNVLWMKCEELDQYCDRHDIDVLSSMNL